MAAARVVHLRKLGPRPIVETEQTRGVAAETVATRDVKAVVERGCGRVIKSQRQARARGPDAAVEYPGRLQAVARPGRAAHHGELSPGRGPGRPPQGGRAGSLPG